MQIRDLGDEAIGEILDEAIDGMKRRTGKWWRLDLDGEHGELRISCEDVHVTTANVRPILSSPSDGGAVPPEAIRFRSALRRLVLEATQAVSPVPGAANVPAALPRAFSAIQALEASLARKDLSFAPVIRHDLHRILDHLTGNDHSGCSSKPSVEDYGRVVDLAPGEVLSMPKGVLVREVTTHADGTTRVRTAGA